LVGQRFRELLKDIPGSKSLRSLHLNSMAADPMLRKTLAASW
jgi:hypothetical protein